MFLAGGAIYHMMGGNLHISHSHHGAALLLMWVSLFLEVIGLLVLRHKIAVQKSARGVSGWCLVMYAVVYAVRMGLAWDFSGNGMDPNMLVGFISLILTLDVLRSVFITHRKTY